MGTDSRLDFVPVRTVRLSMFVCWTHVYRLRPNDRRLCGYTIVNPPTFVCFANE